MKDLVEAFFEYNEVSPEAQQAQRMAEIKDLCAFRARHIPAYKKWSTLEEIDRRRAEQEAEANEARLRGTMLAYEAKRQIEESKLNPIDGPSLFSSHLKLTPIHITRFQQQKESIFSKITGWFNKKGMDADEQGTVQKASAKMV